MSTSHPDRPPVSPIVTIALGLPGAYVLASATHATAANVAFAASRRSGIDAKAPTQPS